MLFAFAFSLVVLLIVPMDGNCAPCSTMPYRIEGGSMSPRIAPNQIIAIAKGPTECWGVLERNDIVLFHSDSMKIPLIKALRALPGDTFSTENGRLIVNGKAVTNSQGVAYQLSVPRATMIGLYAQEFHGVIPPEKFLVMGENPAGTTDSSRFGLIERAQILGKVVER